MDLTIAELQAAAPGMTDAELLTIATEDPRKGAQSVARSELDARAAASEDDEVDAETVDERVEVDDEPTDTETDGRESVAGPPPASHPAALGVRVIVDAIDVPGHADDAASPMRTPTTLHRGDFVSYDRGGHYVAALHPDAVEPYPKG